MERVRAFTIPGLNCWFYSHDHEPPHFHAKRAGEWEYRVFFLLGREEMLERVFGDRRISAAQRRELFQLVETHRLALLDEWFAVRGDGGDNG